MEGSFVPSRNETSQLTRASDAPLELLICHENALAAPASGTVKAINFGSGDNVAKGDVLCVIG